MNNFLFLPFDHRATFAQALFGFNYPPTKAQALKVAAMKGVIFEAFLKVRAADEHPEELAILIDEKFGAQIIKKAKKSHIPLAITVEKSGQEIFDFEYGEKFGDHLSKIKPRFAKVLVRYNPEEFEINKTQQQRLKELARFCKTHNIKLLIELLVNGQGSRSTLIEESIKQLLKAGVKADVWKLEGLDKVEDWKQIGRLTQGSTVIVLGRGETKRQVAKWLKIAAKSGQTQGFAIGRTIFFDALKVYRDKKINRQTAVEKIAKNYTDFIKLWRANS